MRTKTNFGTLFVCFLLGILLLQGCKSSSVLTGFEIGNLYSAHMEYTLEIASIYNINDSISTITVLIPTAETDRNTKQGQKAKRKLTIEVISKERRPHLIDSATFLITDTSKVANFISQTWDFKAPTGKDYYIKAACNLSDPTPDLITLQYLRKQSKTDAGWFRFQTNDGQFLPVPLINYSQPLRIITELPLNQNLIVKVYSKSFDIPLPPFVEEYRARFDYIPDSVFTIPMANGVSNFFNPQKKGFYFFQSDTAALSGATLMVMDPEFPKVSTHKTMIETLRYVTSNADYRSLMSNGNPKMAIDSFWVSGAGRVDIATQLIKKYYGRVIQANELFTSFAPGWKTDRGMIFIVMGKPTQVFRSIDQEVWIYGEYNDSRALRLYFDFVNNPFTTNDFVLNRHAFYKTLWYQNVQMWRR